MQVSVRNMKMKWKNVQRVLYWTGIAILVFGPIIILGNLPGMYSDAVNPDYAALHVYNSQGSDHKKWMFAWPYLTQAYHGNLNVLISLLVISITGTTSVLQHHILNGTYFYVILILMFDIMKKCNIKDVIVRMILLVAASMTSIIIICITQYYIELPGVIFWLLAISFLVKNIKEKGSISIKDSLIASTFMGLAFYCYFNFIFLLLPFMYIVVHNIKSDKIFLQRILSVVYGFLFGCSGYFLGYTQLYFDKYLQGKRMFLFVPFFYLMLILGIWGMLSRKKEYILKTIGLNTVCVAVWGYCVMPIAINKMRGLNISGTEANIWQRIVLIWQYIKGIFSGYTGERLIYKTTVMKGMFFYLIVLFLVLIVVCFICWKNSIVNKKSLKYLIIISISVIIYLVQCIIFATRMQAQHMVPLLWIYFFVIAFGVDIGMRYGKEWIKYIIYVTIVVCIALNLYNTSRVVSKIKDTGGNGLYSSQINVLAEEALKNKNMSRKEAYVFPEWGFFTGFVYLTMNEVPYTTFCHTGEWEKWIEEGYSIRICYWDENNQELYRMMLEECGYKKEEIQEYVKYELSGDVAFYIMEGE